MGHLASPNFGPTSPFLLCMELRFRFAQRGRSPRDRWPNEATESGVDPPQNGKAAAEGRKKDLEKMIRSGGSKKRYQCTERMKKD
jgi:hypothetical protein